MADRAKNREPGMHGITGGPGERIGLWGWFALYATGAALFFLLLTHILGIHFFHPEKLSAAAVYERYRSPFLAINSVCLLVVGVVHGMIGLRRTILDLDLLSRKGDRILILMVVAVGVGLAGFGLVVFRAFYQGS